MKRSHILHFMCLFVVVMIFTSCDRDDSPLKPDENLVRASVRLSTDDIPALSGATTKNTADRPWLREAGWLEQDQECYFVAKFSYSWEKDSDNSVSVELFVAETEELAHKYLIEKRSTCSMPLDMLEPQDQPAVTGDVSYGNGREFIRDNIIISIIPFGEFQQKVTALATQIDKVLLKSMTAKSATELKPVINTFEIEKNPVRFRSATRLLIEVTDPMGGGLFYNWRFKPGVANWGGIETDQSGNYYYYAETTESTEKLTLIILNEHGFYSTATILIDVEQ